MATLALGTGMIGGHKRRFEQPEANTMFNAAWDRGIRHFDTATLYGLGRAHQLLGRWLRLHPRKSDEIFISTKVARYLVPPDAEHPYDPEIAWPGGNPKGQHLDYSQNGATLEIEEALNALGVDHVDALYVHDIDIQNHGDKYPQMLEQVMQGAWPALEQYKSRHPSLEIGIGVNNWEPAADMMKRGARFDSMLLAGRYTLLDQSSLDMLAMAGEYGTKVYLGGALNSGILVDGDVTAKTYNYVPITDDDLKQRVKKLKTFADDHNVPLAALALQFAAAHPAIHRIVLGPNGLDELHQNIDWFEFPIAQKTWQDLASSGLVDKRAPIPTVPPSPISAESLVP